MARRAPPRSYAIVLGTDFSTGSQIAQARAAALSLRYRAALHVVHAAPRLPLALSRKFSTMNEDKPRAALRAVVDELRNGGVDAHGHLMHSDPITALTVKARAVAADVVVVGTRGGAVLEAMVGSTAERLVATDQHRVLLVRRPTTRAYRSVVIAANEESRLREQVAAAAFISSKPPTVLHAYEAPFEASLISRGIKGSELSSYKLAARREAEQGMARLLVAAGLNASQLVLRHGNAFRVLERFDPDSLIILSRGRSRARHLLFGSVTRAVVAHGHSDVLLV
jgi:universal stress protein E